ncbi:helix-turn-helix domain-containing protein [Companilactobacillus mishanensis]|uniref:helix-turn-helix domain-containing protein n=1 Tax=Companilactobacillus mishanensis TaxID=2486008 RepID=UPI0012979B80|nr:helix-turn-helix transcriptional regulator [Companilactobacillus mishanensis]
MENSNFGNILRGRRQNLNLTIEQLAEKANVSVSLVSRVERNVISSLSLEKLSSIATALGLSLSDIFSNTSFDSSTTQLFNYIISLNDNDRHKISDSILTLINAKNLDK